MHGGLSVYFSATCHSRKFVSLLQR